jgi:hypothetical protein
VCDAADIYPCFLVRMGGGGGAGGVFLNLYFISGFVIDISDLLDEFFTMDPYLLQEAAAAAVSAKAAITTTSIFSLPEEVNLKIIALLDPFDVWSLARTCKFFAKLTDNDLLWRHQWAKLSAKTPFRFPPSQNLQVRGNCQLIIVCIIVL